MVAHLTASHNNNWIEFSVHLLYIGVKRFGVFGLLLNYYDGVLK